MELGEHEGDIGGMPLPMLMSSYGAPPNVHESSKLKPPAASMNADHHQNGSTGTPSDETRASDQQHQAPPPAAAKKSVRYRECLKNHAASIGGHAIDGCGDFMPSGEEGTLEALKCAACNCHRNFHRREVEGEPPCYYCYNSRKDGRRPRGGVVPGGGPPMPPLLNPPHGATPLALPSSQVSTPRYPPHQMIMALGHGEGDDGVAGGYMNPYGGSSMSMGMPLMKKRFRTKFTNEQKEKMSAFAEKLGWRIQKHDEAAVQQFCMDVGVKRHVLKVWMHNNKSHVLAKTNREQCSSQ
uniref:ZF-HD dimerization-type domain-containing protein n=1 Tax=Araucaria cunninghamii TaxID=56994 RepID=A0A0D6R164_ARACU